MGSFAVFAAWILGAALVIVPPQLRHAQDSGTYGGPAPEPWLEILLQLGGLLLPILVTKFPEFVRDFGGPKDWALTARRIEELLKRIAAWLETVETKQTAMEARYENMARRQNVVAERLDEFAESGVVPAKSSGGRKR